MNFVPPQEALIESPGWSLIIRCLGLDAITSKAAIELLYELLQDRSGWNVSICRKLSQKDNAILFLVILFKGSVQETAKIAENILLKLLEVDQENIHRAAKANWYKPLIDCIVKGKRILSHSKISHTFFLFFSTKTHVNNHSI